MTSSHIPGERKTSKINILKKQNEKQNEGPGDTWHVPGFRRMIIKQQLKFFQSVSNGRRWSLLVRRSHQWRNLLHPVNLALRRGFPHDYLPLADRMLDPWPLSLKRLQTAYEIVVFDTTTFLVELKKTKPCKVYCQAISSSVSSNTHLSTSVNLPARVFRLENACKDQVDADFLFIIQANKYSRGQKFTYTQHWHECLSFWAFNDLFD